MPAVFSRVKNWISETLTAADLDAEFNNILNNLDPTGIGQYSYTVAQMQLQTSPGTLGAESLATSLGGEIERIRYVIKQLIGASVSYWYQGAPSSITDLLAAVGGQVQSNRIVSGAMSTNSSAPRYLVASNTTQSVTLKATTTNFNYFINNVQYTATADTTFTPLNGAPTTSNTALINDPTLTGQEASKWTGEDGTQLLMTAAGTNITNLTGKYGAFKVVSGGLTEYFIGYVQSSTIINNCLRGCFLNSTLTPTARIVLTNSSTISVMGLAWLFVNTTGGLAVSYVNPQISAETPSSTLGYWFDLANQSWKTYSGATWVTAAQTFVGFSVQDTAACVGTRGLNFFANYSDYSNLVVDYNSSTQLQARNYGSKVAIGSSLIDFKMFRPIWDITANVETTYGVSASTTYFAYLGESGQIKLSPTKPYFSQDMGRGWYHPYENWRAMASIFNNAGSSFDSTTVRNYLASQNDQQPFTAPDDIRNIGMTVTMNASAMIVSANSLSGLPLSPGNPGFASFRSGVQTAGTVVTRQYFSNLNMTVPSGATLGTFGALNQNEWVYLTDNNGLLDMAIAGMGPPQEANLQATTQLSNTSTVAKTVYSQGASAASVAIRLLGRVTTNQTMPGQWVTGPSSVALRPPLLLNVEDWGAVNRTLTMVNFGTIASATFQTRRIGDSLECMGYFISGVAAGAAASMTLGNGLTADSTKFTGVGPVTPIGHFWALTTGGGTFFGTANAVGALFMDSSVSSTSIVFADAGAAKQFQYSNANTICVGTSWAVGFSFKVPIAGWTAYGPS